MSLPVNAQVHAAQSFVISVRNAYEFLQKQDPYRAEERYQELLEQLGKARERLKWNPASGRPARLLSLKSEQGRALAPRVKAQAESLGVPELRELILKPYVLLYAHGKNQVFLLSLRHERQLLVEVG
ncbi:hypothetical protein H0A66_04025 [Alcaligenaceae bacterium]|nr:hypothetical protein [Alcaligenaceae bacterium]